MKKKKKQTILIGVCTILVLFLFINCSEESSVYNNEPIITDDSIVFTKSNETLGNTRTFGLAISDIDLDNNKDVFIVNYVGASNLWMNIGDSTFEQNCQVFNIAEVHDADFADFNGDSYPDILLVSHANSGKIYFNNGDGSFTTSEQNIGLASNYPNTIDLGDIDGDEDIDAFIFNLGKPNGLWLNDGNGFFTKINTDYGGSDGARFLRWLILMVIHFPIYS